jgi:adenylosuccinate synthase
MVTVVVGGQFGSEGKGKVAHYVTQRERAAAVVRVGGSNSGHSAVSHAGEIEVLRQLPTAALLEDVLCVLGAGTYIDVPVLLEEIERLEISRDRLIVDPRAMIVTSDDRASEESSALRDRIGSTRSGTGAAVSRRTERRADSRLYLAESSRYLKPYVREVTPMLRALLSSDERVVIEGTQGLGLSLLHSPYYPYVTSRDTSAAGALSEAGLSPRDVQHVILVLRAFPIRVAGNSGPLPREIDWETIATEGGHTSDLHEYTSVTGRLRRVARFDADIVRRAISVNSPDEIVLNHLDYVDAACTADGYLTEKARSFIASVQEKVGTKIDFVGLSPTSVVRVEGLRTAEAGMRV